MVDRVSVIKVGDMVNVRIKVRFSFSKSSGQDFSICRVAYMYQFGHNAFSARRQQNMAPFN